MSELQLTDGTLWYETAGSGPPLVLLHGGFGFDHTYFRPWLDLLSDQFQLVFVDLRGNGRSADFAPQTVTLEAMAGDIELLLNHLSFEQAHILGHSFGGAVAINLAVTAPARINKLTLVSTTPKFDFEAIGARMLAKEPEAWMLAVFGENPPMRNDAEYRHAIYGISPIYYTTQNATRDETTYGDMICRLDAFLHGNGLIAGFDRWQALAGCKNPTWVATGAHDHIVSPAECRAYAAKMDNASVSVFADSGHFPFIEEQERFLAALRRFLAA